MKIIILTKNHSDGSKLSKSLKNLDHNFNSIINFTREQVVSEPHKFVNTLFIFSTWYMPLFSEKEIKEYFPSLKAIFYAAGSVKYFANNYFKNNVRIFSAAKANAVPVAEFTASQIILANKGYFQAQVQYKKPFWKFSFNKARKYAFDKKGNYKAKIGIIGCGAVGSKVIDLLKPYNLEIFVFDPFISSKRAKELGVEKVSLVDIFKNSDVISNHLPDIPSTKGIINIKLLSQIKENVTFINTGRGAQVIEKDLIKVLSSKPNMCALLDVTNKEPIRPWSKLLFLNNVFITPHIAGSLSNEKDRMIEYMVNSFLNFIENSVDLNEVFKKDIYKQT